jgi:hypothetical protein
MQNVTFSQKERADHAGKIMSGPFSTTFKKRDHFTPSYRVYRDPPGMSGYRRVAVRILTITQLLTC